MNTYSFCHLEKNDNQIYLACTDMLSMGENQLWNIPIEHQKDPKLVSSSETNKDMICP